MEVVIEVRDNKSVVAKKIVQRKPGFFAYRGMKYLFSWSGGNHMATIIEVIHDESSDKMWLIFGFNLEIKEVILGQTDWKISNPELSREAMARSVQENRRLSGH